ncbi:SDR family oxidoreductase [Novosphingobium sp. ST904]|uniref:SDR family NAD(P)-dependent oxidoreductase n=1 Tax=Novosphingobium sp. ST904 TaxID=1684385 RepID=UPI000B0F4374|nr:enoyl-ACP reductase-like protein [Novosphingobium sp. ST904]
MVPIVSDASRLGDLDTLFEAVARHGKLDILVANAGGSATAALGSITEEQFDREFDVNVKGLLFTVQNALPHLVDGASIVLLGSTQGSSGVAGMSVYSAAKAAVRSFARSWILDLKDRAIRVNVVSPGPVDTDAFQDYVREQGEAVLAHLHQAIPLGRVAQPQDVAAATLYLASQDAAYINGIELFVDGGMRQV